MNKAATAFKPSETPAWEPEGYRILSHHEKDAAVLQIEPEAMIPAREGEWHTFLAQVGIFLTGPIAWLIAGIAGYGATAQLGIALVVWIVLGGYGLLELFLFAVRRTTRGHWRYGVFMDASHVAGSPQHGEAKIDKRDIAFFALKRQPWSLRPWLRYAIIGQLHDGRQIRLTPSIMRRKQAAEVAAVLDMWRKAPGSFVQSVRQGEIWQSIWMSWEYGLPGPVALRADKD